jgi:hypothetical protein
MGVLVFPEDQPYSNIVSKWKEHADAVFW